MSNKKKMLLCGALLLASQAHADMTMKTFRQLANNPREAKALEFYLDGLTEGEFWSAVYSRVTNRPAIFCLPGNLPLTTDTAKSLILNSKQGDTDYAAPTLLIELQKAFPCTR